MSAIYAEFPMVECPHCRKEFQVEDYYDIKSGDTITCTKCEGEILVQEVDQITTARLSKAGEIK